VKTKLCVLPVFFNEGLFLLKRKPWPDVINFNVLVILLLAGGLLTSCEIQAPDDDKLILNDGDESTSGLCTVPEGQAANATYTIEWSAIIDNDLTGYRIYFSSDADLTKNNNQGWIDVSNSSTNAQFLPGTYAFKTCDEVYVAVTSLGIRPESAISEVTRIIVH